MSKEQREEMVKDYAVENQKCAEYFLGKEELFGKQVDDGGENRFTLDDMMEISIFLWKSKQAQIAIIAQKCQSFQAQMDSEKQAESWWKKAIM